MDWSRITACTTGRDGSAPGTLTKPQDANGNEVTYAYLRDGADPGRPSGLDRMGRLLPRLHDLRAATRSDPLLSSGVRALQQHRLAARRARGQGGAAAGSTPIGRTPALHPIGLDGAVAAERGRGHRYRSRRLAARAAADRPRLCHAGAGGPVVAHAQRGAAGWIPAGSERDPGPAVDGSGLPDVLETTATGHWLRENLGQGRSDRRDGSPHPARCGSSTPAPSSPT